MDSTIVLFLLQDGLTNGAIYALLGLGLVLVFTVTRVVLVPQGEFVTYGALTYALLESGKRPGTAGLLLTFGVLAFCVEIWSRRRSLTATLLLREAATKLVLPLAIVSLTFLAVAVHAPPAVNFLLAVLIVAPIGPYLYRIAFQPLAEASVLTLLIAAVGVHLAMIGLGLAFFGPEGWRAPAMAAGSFRLGPLVVSGQSIAVYVITLAFIAALYLFFGKTLFGKALRATAVNRVGARLVGIRTDLSGRIAFTLAAIMGAVSGILIVPATTIYYDTGFLLGLKGFVAAIMGGLVSYPLTAIAALGVGCAESFSSFYASNFKEVIVFTLIIPVLVLRSLATRHLQDEEE